MYILECPAVRRVTSLALLHGPRQRPAMRETFVIRLWQGCAGACPPAPDPSPVSVADVDECELGTHNCPAGAVCRNTEGSFHCQARERCLEGFLQDPEGNCVGERGLPGCVCRPRGGGWGWSSGRVLGGMGLRA